MSSQCKMVKLPKDIADKIIRFSTGRTDSMLQKELGISYNTWRKIKRGQPLRESLAARIISRISII
jgi:uncharacterized protein (DUF2384 family)